MRLRLVALWSGYWWTKVGFADPMRGSGHGSGGYVSLASFEVYGKPIKR
jgi:hypothetical protein